MSTATQPQLSITAEEYHKLPGVSNSRLSVYMEDFREYYHQFVSGLYEEEQKDHFDFGTAVHDISLLGINNIQIIPSEVLTKDGKRSGNAWKDFKADNEGKLLMKAADYRKVMQCVNAVRKHPLASELLSAPGYTERCYSTQDDCGLLIRCRPDKLCAWRSKNIVVDIKTTATGTTAKKFVKSIANFGYAQQEAFYRKVLEANDVQVDAFIFIAVKESMPHCVDCYTVSRRWHEFARKKVDTALADLARRTINNDWESATANSVVELEPPAWVFSEGDYSL